MNHLPWRRWPVAAMTALLPVLMAGEPGISLRHWARSAQPHPSQSYSLASQIDGNNVSILASAWNFPYPRVPGRAETTPLVRDGVMYLSIGSSGVCAVDAATGARIWCGEYAPAPLDPIADSNRGLALAGGRLFLITADGYLAAIEAAGGRLAWKSRLSGYYRMPGPAPAPLVARGAVIAATRGFLEAFDMGTGRRIWRFSTRPDDDLASESAGLEPNDSQTAVTGAYDPTLGLLYHTYSSSILALDPATGSIVWEFGFPIHPSAEPDENQAPVLIDAEWRGEPRRLLAQANRNGFFYLLDRVDGRRLLAKPYARENFGSRVPVSDSGSKMCPDVYGATGFQTAAFHPSNSLFYVITRDACSRVFPDGIHVDIHESQPLESLKAIDIETGEIRWMYDFTMLSPMSHAGVLATAGGLVFFGIAEGYLVAADASTGKIEWMHRTPGRIRAAPISYTVDGRQYVAIATSDRVETFALPERAPRTNLATR